MADFALWMYRQGFKIILPDITMDQFRLEERSSHDDGSQCDYDAALSQDGIIEKCVICGDEKRT